MDAKLELTVNDIAEAIARKYNISSQVYIDRVYIESRPGFKGEVELGCGCVMNLKCSYSIKGVSK